MNPPRHHRRDAEADDEATASSAGEMRSAKLRVLAERPGDLLRQPVSGDSTSFNQHAEPRR